MNSKILPLIVYPNLWLIGLGMDKSGVLAFTSFAVAISTWRLTYWIILIGHYYQNKHKWVVFAYTFTLELKAELF